MEIRSFVTAFEKRVRKSFLIGLGVLISMPAFAAEIITVEDIEEEVIVTEQLIRLTDNAIFLFDTSSSMNEKFQDTGKSRLEVVESEMKKRNSYLPDLGYNFGLYIYTPWQPIFEMAPYDRKGVENALDKLPAKGSGPTRLTRGLDNLFPILKKLSGQTAIFVFTDGGYTDKKRPITAARALANAFDVCFYVISTAKDSRNVTIAENVAGLNECSRVIPFAYFLNRPQYTSGALFEVAATAEIITRTDTRIVGVDLDPLSFGFDSVELDAAPRKELDEVADFLGKNPAGFVVINGYTDNTGPEEYNLSLSHRRVESAAAYLTDKHGVARDRIVLYWYGQKNPVASNDTREGRAKNRRVEMAVGGL